MRKLATIRVIENVTPIDGADAIECITIGGWKCVAKLNEFKRGDLCVYFEVDSILPSTDKRYEFLAKGFKEYPTEKGIMVLGHRLRTVKLRGQISQGLALPLTAFPELANKQVDADVTDILGINKYEVLPTKGTQGRGKTNSFPSYLIKSDQERCQNMAKDIFADMNKKYEITQKLDGSSATYFYKDGIVGLCSRNLQLAVPDGINPAPKQSLFAAAKKLILKLLGKAPAASEADLNSFWHQAANKYDIFNLLKKCGTNIALQGEIIAPSIQAGHEKVKELEFYVYAVQHTDKYGFLSPSAARDIVNDLNIVADKIKLQYVPLLHKEASLQELGITDINALLAYAEGGSLLNKECKVREGLVFKAVDGSGSFKVISNAYLLKKDKKD